MSPFGDQSVSPAAAGAGADRQGGESSGFWSGQLDADIGATPLLRHRVELGTGSVTDDELGRPLALISELRYPATDSIEQLPTGGTLLGLAGDATLLTWQGQRLPPD